MYLKFIPYMPATAVGTARISAQLLSFFDDVVLPRCGKKQTGLEGGSEALSQIDDRLARAGHPDRGRGRRFLFAVVYLQLRGQSRARQSNILTQLLCALGPCSALPRPERLGLVMKYTCAL